MMYFINKDGRKVGEHSLFNYFTEEGFTRDDFECELEDTEGFINLLGQDYSVAEIVVTLGGKRFDQMYWDRVDQLCSHCIGGDWEDWFESCVDEDGNEVEDYPIYHC